MDKQTKDLRELMKIVYGKGLNIYALTNKIQGITCYSIPPSVIERICNEYLKYKDTIKSPWAWGNKVARLIRDQVYTAGIEAKNKVEFKQVNKDLMERLFAGTKFGGENGT